jgi:Trypsin
VFTRFTSLFTRVFLSRGYYKEKRRSQSMSTQSSSSALGRVLYVLTIFMSLFFNGCEDASDPIHFETHSQTIIGGENETGYPAVGSIVFKKWLSQHSSCTATLIKEDWILTAAHCIKDGTKGLTFSTGPTATAGKRYQFAEAITHPRYYDNPIGSLYDIALIRLAEPVPGDVAIPISYTVTSMDSLIGESVLYIGYGSTSGTTSILGLGKKRRVSLPIERIDPITYSHGFDGSGLCFGDSGGPGLVEIDGELQIIGVTSASLGCQGDACEPCSNGSKHTRVDSFSDWIAAQVGDDFVACEQNSERCVCDLACDADGICDNALCVTDTCGDITDCIFGLCADNPDGACSTGCVDDGSIEAREEFLNLVDCWAVECRSILGSDNERECLMDKCSVEWDSCSAQVNPDTAPTTDADADGDTDADASTDKDADSDADAGNGYQDTEDESNSSGGSCQMARRNTNELSLFFVLGLLTNY